MWLLMVIEINTSSPTLDILIYGVCIADSFDRNSGDTANKIGTYSLAVSAKYHSIPFFVAAPLTSVDLCLSSGGEIIIEERSPKELLNTHGGLGEQVAASGISVWNPAFDVTPASLISGIITEKVGDYISVDQLHHVLRFKYLMT